MANILIVAATAAELSTLSRELRPRTLPHSRLDLWQGESPARGHRVTLLVTGVGKSSAALRTAALLESGVAGGLDCIIQTGVCGAYGGSGLDVGDVAVATSEIMGDEGVLTPQGWQSMVSIAIPLMTHRGVRYFNEFPLSQARSEQAVRLAATLGIPLRRGKFVTVSTCSGTAARGDELAARFGAICESMEGAAVAQVAITYEIPCLEIRGVSNRVEDRDLSAWNIPVAAEAAQRFVLRYIDQMEEP